MIRSGKGAAVMGPGVKRLAMVFSARSAGGNMGARYNPSVVWGWRANGWITDIQTGAPGNSGKTTCRV